MLSEWVKKRQEIALRYQQRLKGIPGIEIPGELSKDLCGHSWNQFVIRIMDNSFLKNLRVKRGLTVVLVEQNLEFISALSDRVYVIRRGVFTGELSPDQLANPEIVQEFVGMN